MIAKRPIFLLCSCLALLSSRPVSSQEVDPAERFVREARHRAEYWSARGYEFDPFLMSADSMDRYVKNHKRASYWAERGFQFDPSKWTAFAMDRQAEARLRAEYWRRWGIEFDSKVMDAATMDDAAIKLKQVQAQLEEIRKTEVGEDEPAIVVDEASAGLLSKPPKVVGTKNQARAAGVSAVPFSLPSLGQVGARGGGGRQGNAGFGGGQGGSAAGSSGGSRSAGRGIQIPSGVDPQDFFDFVSGIRNAF